MPQIPMCTLLAAQEWQWQEEQRHYKEAKGFKVLVFEGFLGDAGMNAFMLLAFSYALF